MRLLRRKQKTYPGIRLVIRAADGQEIVNVDSAILYYLAKFGSGDDGLDLFDGALYKDNPGYSMRIYPERIPVRA